MAFLAVTAPSVPAADAPSNLQSLFREQWEFRLQEDPLFATNAGDHRYNDRVPSRTAMHFQRREAFARRMLSQLQAVDVSQVSVSDRVSRDMLVRELTHELAGYEFGTYRWHWWRAGWRLPSLFLYDDIAVSPPSVSCSTAVDFVYTQ